MRETGLRPGEALLSHVRPRPSGLPVGPDHELTAANRPHHQTPEPLQALL